MLRKKNKLTQVELAEKVHVKQSTIQAYESGRAKPFYGTAVQLAKVLGVSKNTWTNRMKEPWKAFSYDDFKALAKYCRVDFIQLVDGELKIR